LRSLLRDYRIAVFAACAILFHFANTAMLSLLGMRLSAAHPHESTLYMSACIALPIRGVLYTLTNNPYLLYTEHRFSTV
jgi:hypothetical protein